MGELLLRMSIFLSLKERKLFDLRNSLRNIVPDISEQHSHAKFVSKYHEDKARAQHAFQISIMLKAISMIGKKKITIVDIGDSAGTHLKYLMSLCKEHQINAISVDIDPKAVEKIKSKGMKAILSSAENLDLGDESIDLFTSFEMVEHLVNPCNFFRNMAVKGKSNMMLVTVPYVRKSRISLRNIRRIMTGKIKFGNSDPDTTKLYPEQQHIFEFSPEDWKVIMLFCGWRVVYENTYLQYPRWHIFYLFRYIWRFFDFEGFWGVVLEKDLNVSNSYLGWQD